MPRPDLEHIVERIDLVQRGPRTLTGKRALLTELEQVRRNGLATSDEELESALRSIAAPTRSRSGEVVAAINVAIPWSPVAMNELARRPGPTVQAAANEIAAHVICQPSRAGASPRTRRPLNQRSARANRSTGRHTRIAFNDLTFQRRGVSRAAAS